MELGLKNKVAVVFAASKGLGKSSAVKLAEEGCRVAVCSRDERNIENAAQEIRQKTGAEVFSAVVDVRHKDQISGFIRDVINKWGTVDVLVTNAGGPPVKSFEETSDDEWEKYFQITLMSVVTAFRAVLPQMKKQKSGKIINITSMSVKEPIANLVLSNSLRLAVVGLAKTVATEVGPYGIHVHNVAPGFHATDGLERLVEKRIAAGETREAVYESWKKIVPLRRIGDPAEFGGLVAFLASDQSSYMTGNTIQIDGGRFSGAM